MDWGEKIYFQKQSEKEDFKFLKSQDIENFIDKNIPYLELICCPAQHFSNRSIWDRDATLWSSWLAITHHPEFHSKKIYFAGDTGSFSYYFFLFFFVFLFFFFIFIFNFYYFFLK